MQNNEYDDYELNVVYANENFDMEAALKAITNISYDQLLKQLLFYIKRNNYMMSSCKDFVSAKIFVYHNNNEEFKTKLKELHTDFMENIKTQMSLLMTDFQNLKNTIKISNA